MAVVAVQKVRVRVVGHIDITVTIEIRRHDSQPVGLGRVRHAHLVGRVRERSVAVVVKETVFAAPQPERTGHDFGCVLPDRGSFSSQDVVESAVDVLHDVEVEPPVSIGIKEGRTGTPARCGHTGAFGDFLKRAIAPISIQPTRAKVRHVQIDVAIVVEVCGTDTTAPVVTADAAFSTGSAANIALPSKAETNKAFIASSPVACERAGNKPKSSIAGRSAPTRVSVTSNAQG